MTKLLMRFWSKVSFPRGGSDGCWLWTGCRTSKGIYGQFTVNDRSRLAHLVAWAHYRGAVPAGLQLDHTCRNGLCVRPDHLEPVTHEVNTLRSTNPAAQNAQKTHCARGHLFDPANTTCRKGRAERRCRKCHNAEERERKRASARRATGETTLDRGATAAGQGEASLGDAPTTKRLSRYCPHGDRGMQNAPEEAAQVEHRRAAPLEVKAEGVTSPGEQRVILSETR